MTITIWLTIVTICLLGAMSPGPSLVVVLRQAISSGRKAGLITAIAHGIGIGLYAMACISGIAVIITTSPILFTTLKWAGAGYLLWLGIKGLMIREGKNETLGDSISRTSPVSSANGTNSSGEIKPCSGCCQRSNASTPMISPDLTLT